MARRIAQNLKGGEVIELVGDVGSGKTTFTQGLAAGLGYQGDVPSPTFTLSRAYPVKDGRTLYHFDFYRLGGHDIVTDELDEVMQDTHAITAIEWAGQGEAQLPMRRIRITIEPGATADSRQLTIESLGKALDYVLKGVAS